MPVLKNIDFVIDVNAVLLRQGFKDPSKVRPEMKEMAEALLQEARASDYFQTALTYETCRVLAVDAERMTLEGGAVLNGPLLPSRVPAARELILMVSTIGPKLETRVKEYTNSGDKLKGLMLDGIGSVAMHAFTQEACVTLSRMLAADGIEFSRPFNPGMEGFPLTEQAQVLRLARADCIGVSLKTSGIMVPRKSASRVIAVTQKAA